MSRYRKTMLEALQQVREQDHEISMARGELEAIADKALQLASILKSKTDDDNLEAWVQSKITKAKDYINSVNDYMTYNPEQKQNEELEEAKIVSDISGVSINKLKQEVIPFNVKVGKVGPGMDSDYEVEFTGSEPNLIKYAKKHLDFDGNNFSQLKKHLAMEELEEAEDYGLRGTITDKQLQNIKSVWANKTKKDITPGVKTMLSKLDSPTRLAIKQAKINVLSDLVEEMNEGFSSSLKQKAKEIAKKFANNMTKAVDEIEKLAKGLSDEPEVYKVIRQYNEDTTQRPSPANPTGKELDEKMMPGYAVRYTKGDERLVQAFKSKDDAEKRARILKYAAGGKVKDVSITGPHNLNFKEFTEELEEGIMKDIYTMDKEGASAEEIAKRLKLKVSAVKSILGEQKEEPTVETKPEVKKEDDKESKLASKDQQIETLKGQVALLKQKVENEKNKAIKPEPNPKTGEVPLTIGIAYKEFKKQELKKDEVKESKDFPPPSREIYQSALKRGFKGSYDDFRHEYSNAPDDFVDIKTGKPFKEEIHPHAKKMAKDGVSAEKIKKMHPEITADELEKITEDNLKEKVADSIIKDLQKAYAPMKGKTISPEMANKMSKHLDQPSYDLDTLRQLVKANIPFISTLARNKIYRKTGKFEERRFYIESLSALKDKADKTGMPYNILKQVYDRGMAAWKSGHRPGAGQHQWALARVNSFVTKSSGTWGGADKDLAAKVKGSK